jgi:hypothetical protein
VGGGVDVGVSSSSDPRRENETAIASLFPHTAFPTKPVIYAIRFD